MSLILPFIMCGGSGTRMWPVSRESLPKQFIPLLDERSTFQTTLAMLARQELFAPPCVITNRDYRFLVGEQMQSVGVTGDIVLEPMRRDSGPAVAVAHPFPEPVLPLPLDIRSGLQCKLHRLLLI
jgi:mannose-1-phosphate guanylyltransferase/mannose-6-phosphate isomerase